MKSAALGLMLCSLLMFALIAALDQNQGMSGASNLPELVRQPDDIQAIRAIQQRGRVAGVGAYSRNPGD